mmetsp:Transcript_26002/g.59938  ORF Transcript_26002/g.59938 Transcript_26002/m.59938 type:complete len:307 (-) Transcript_26002:527-1447(-)
MQPESLVLVIAEKLEPASSCQGCPPGCCDCIRLVSRLGPGNHTHTIRRQRVLWPDFAPAVVRFAGQNAGHGGPDASQGDGLARLGKLRGRARNVVAGHRRSKPLDWSRIDAGYLGHTPAEAKVVVALLVTVRTDALCLGRAPKPRGDCIDQLRDGSRHENTVCCGCKRAQRPRLSRFVNVGRCEVHRAAEVMQQRRVVLLNQSLEGVNVDKHIIGHEHQPCVPRKCVKSRAQSIEHQMGLIVGCHEIKSLPRSPTSRDGSPAPSVFEWATGRINNKCDVVDSGLIALAFGTPNDTRLRLCARSSPP